MGIKSQYIIFALLCSCLDAVSQDSTFFLNFEGGHEVIEGKFNDKDYFREISNRNAGFFRSRILSEIRKSFAGVKLEKKTTNQKFGFSTGLRFTHLESLMTKSGVPGYFYLLLRQTGTTTEYLQIKQLTEISNYLGIPLEVYYYRPSARSFRFCFMAGLEWSYRLTTKTDVLFSSSTMETYQSDVAQIIGKSDSWYATFYLRPGFIIGKRRRLLSCGITLPVVITNTVSRLSTPTAGTGFQIQLHLPFKNKRI